MQTMNTLAFLMVLLWTAGWTVASIRAGFRAAPLPGSIRRNPEADIDNHWG